MGNQTDKEKPSMARWHSLDVVSSLDMRTADSEIKKVENEKKEKKENKHNRRRSKDDLDLNTSSSQEIHVTIPRKKKEMTALIKRQAIEIQGKDEIIIEGKKYCLELMDENERCLERIEERDQTITDKNNAIQSMSNKAESFKEKNRDLEVNLSQKEKFLVDATNEIQNLKTQLKEQESIAREIQLAMEKSDVQAARTTSGNGVLVGVEGRLEGQSLRRENERLKSKLRDKENFIDEGRKVLSNLNQEKDQLQRQLKEIERSYMEKRFALDKMSRERERDQIQIRQKDMEATGKGRALERTETELRQAREELKRKDVTLDEKERALERIERMRQQASDDKRHAEQRLEEERRSSQGNVSRIREEKRVCEDRLRRLEANQQVQQQTLQNLEADRNREKQSADILRKDQPWMISKDEITLTDRVLGSGAWGRVFEGSFRGMEVAVKELHEIIKSAHNKLLFDREITFVTLVRHPCILQFLGVADYRSNNPLLVTELMDMSLSDLLAQEKVLGRRYVTTLARDTSYGLNYLHCFRPRPIIHRDVNPGNVMVWRQGDVWRAKLCDFGSAEFLSTNMSINPGNPFYSAPEVNSPKQSTKVDVYSFGVLLCELCTSNAPNPDDRKRQIGLVWNEDLKGLIQTTINENPENRPTMSDVIEVLRPLKR